jgi:hypothetical protein
MEEALRAYFLRAGYYALRSIVLRYEQIDVTDVDIWLYERPSSVSRHRIIVDVKNRKTPQAIERIFWTKGLQRTLGVEQSIVATTDRRAAVADFGRQHDVLVLDGNFLRRLVTTMGGELATRITEEEFRKLLNAYTLAVGAAGWSRRLQLAKSVVLDGLNYNSINFWLEEARYFAEQAITVQGHASTAMRALYLISSLIALAVDFVLKDLAFVEPKDKFNSIAEGLRYGESGRSGTKKIIDVATGLLERYASGGGATASRVRQELQKELGSLPTDILAEYFGRGSTAQAIFAVARELEAAAHAKKFPEPSQLQPESQSLLGALADYWGIDRTRLLGKAVSKAKQNLDGRASEEPPPASDRDPSLLL